MGSPKIDFKQIEIDKQNIQNLPFKIHYKDLGTVPNHDGLGSACAVMFEFKYKQFVLAFKTDYFSGDLEKSSQFMEINYNDFDKINANNYEAKLEEILKSNNCVDDHIFDLNRIEEKISAMPLLYINSMFKNNNNIKNSLIDVVVTMGLIDRLDKEQK